MIVLKVGSGVLVGEAGNINREAVRHIADQAVQLAGRIAIVTSGFAAAGGGRTEEQYAKGRDVIGAAWQEALGGYFGALRLADRGSLAEVARAVLADLHGGAVPLVNEAYGADFGNNDQLSVELAAAIGAGRVVMLSCVNGIYGRFGVDESPIHAADYRQLAACVVQNGATSSLGTGGVEARIRAAEYAGARGITTHVGHWQEFIGDLIGGLAGTTVYGHGVGMQPLMAS